MVTPHKVVLSCISIWCILAIIGEISLKRSHGHLIIMICVKGWADVEEVIEPVVRSLRLGFQISGFEPQLTLDPNKCHRECWAVVTRLVDDGVIYAGHRGMPDMVISVPGPYRLFSYKEVFHEPK